MKEAMETQLLIDIICDGERCGTGCEWLREAADACYLFCEEGCSLEDASDCGLLRHPACCAAEQDAVALTQARDRLAAENAELRAEVERLRRENGVLRDRFSCPGCGGSAGPVGTVAVDGLWEPCADCERTTELLAAAIAQPEPAAPARRNPMGTRARQSMIIIKLTVQQARLLTQLADQGRQAEEARRGPLFANDQKRGCAQRALDRLRQAAWGELPAAPTVTREE